MPTNPSSTVVQIDILSAKEIPADFKRGSILVGRNHSGSIVSLICTLEDLELAKAALIRNKPTKF